MNNSTDQEDFYTGSLDDLKQQARARHEQRHAQAGLNEDAEIDTSLGFEPLTREQRLQRLDQRWERYQQTGRTVSHNDMKTGATPS